MREVIAGCRLVVGDEAARADKCEARGKGLAARVIELTDLDKRLSAFNLWAPLGAGVIGVLLGGAIGVLVAILRPAAVQAVIR